MAIDDQNVFWWHSIRMPDGHVTPGEKSLDVLEQEWRSLRLGELSRKTVVDVGGWDGWFSFRAEAEGAARVVTLDSFVWSLDFTRADEYWDYVHSCEERGEPYDLWGPDCAFWDGRQLLGKRGFDRAREALNSNVESVVADFMTGDIERVVGSFDIALFLGVLYHMREPLRSLERLRSISKELAVIETGAVAIENYDDLALVEFVQGYAVNQDPTNWFLPTERALHDLCIAAGFRSVDTVARSVKSTRPRAGVSDYRLVVHARP